MSSEECTRTECTILEHIRAKKGYCGACGGCKKCPPINGGVGTCNGTGHVGTRKNKVRTTVSTRTARKQGATVMRPAKRKAVETMSSAFNDAMEDLDEINPPKIAATVQDLLKMLDIDEPLAYRLKKNATKRTLTKWVDTMEKIIEQCLFICVEDDARPLKELLTM